MPPPPVPKRPNYFASQFLVVRDFQDEQAYHEELLRRHNRLMHEWGVIRGGLEVTKSGADFTIGAGSAIDSLGREIILESARTLSAADVQAARQAAGQDVFVTIEFGEDNSTFAEDKYPPPNGTENVTRKVPFPRIVATRTPASDGTVIILARIAGNGSLPAYARKLASSYIPRGTNLGDISLDGLLSFTSKSSPVPQVGLEYDSTGDQLRIRARSQDASILDTTLVTIKRGSGNVGIGTTDAPGQKLELAGALRLTTNPTVTNDQISALFWNQKDVGPTIAGGNFEVRTGGDTTRLRIDGVGNVGIGTTGNAGQRLEVAGALKLSGLPTVNNDNLGVYIWNQDKIGPTIAGFGFEVRTGGNTPRLKIDSDGNVGIGTTPAAGQKLEVAGALKLSTSPTLSTDNNATYIWNQGNIGPTIAGLGFEVRTGGNTPRLRINSAGNVGIGPNAPTAKLSVEGSGSALPATTGQTQSAGLVSRLKGSTNAILDIGAGENTFWIQSTDSTKLETNHSLLLNPNGGNIGIGTTAPRFALHIRKDNKSGLGPTLALMNGAGHEFAQVAIDLFTYWNSEPEQLPSGRIVCEDNAAGSGHLIFQTLDTSTTDKKMVERMRIDAASGNVKISGKISCGGKILIKSSQWPTRYISARGGPTTVDKQDWRVITMEKKEEYEEFTLEMACSREFKENISNLTVLEAMTTLQNLTPVKYDYKGQQAFRQNLGFIAEDMPDNLSSEDRKSISPFEVVPILTRVAKEQQRVIAELQETVRALQSNATKKHKNHKREVQA